MECSTLLLARGPNINETQEILAEVELCAVGKRCVFAQDLKSTAALALWLRNWLPPASVQQISDWVKLPGTKRVANLWLELSQGEISLEDSIAPKRTVHVACVKITNGSGNILLEASQEMVDGTMRERNRPLSEKMKLGESVVDACLRGIREELGHEYGAGNRVQMLQDTYAREVQERESLSYPGLMTCYVLHHMVAVMKDLPIVDFATEENELCETLQDEHTSEESIKAKESGDYGFDLLFLSKPVEYLHYNFDSLNHNLPKNPVGELLRARVDNVTNINPTIQPYAKAFGLQRFRECELIHGQWAMLATLGALAVESFTGVTWQDAGKVELVEGSTYFGLPVPFSISTRVWIEALVIGYIEFQRTQAIINYHSTSITRSPLSWPCDEEALD
ncbi:hypothetical protein L7F22_034058 [Adiantum nelumboides]|nr:hypothetical protein [Adiantum nelumboides]